mmetsp:Transcript_6042/g.18152  ORF Transcript_6042/g.18152 Transcript_6042/m.18152 type:complete len:232 (-) Transcript_6042:146-841(-)
MAVGGVGASRSPASVAPTGRRLGAGRCKRRVDIGVCTIVRGAVALCGSRGGPERVGPTLEAPDVASQLSGGARLGRAARCATAAAAERIQPRRLGPPNVPVVFRLDRAEHGGEVGGLPRDEDVKGVGEDGEAAGVHRPRCHRCGRQVVHSGGGLAEQPSHPSVIRFGSNHPPLLHPGPEPVLVRDGRAATAEHSLANRQRRERRGGPSPGTVRAIVGRGQLGAECRKLGCC